ncbi:hypothetical protein [Prevotella intermedia]|uniref:Uncharacterized protein n=1 Tax=Prevotella intermedia TaxID=28131 RepID=A0A2D3LNQ3_PREIN|nr:hypothetical protein [Prevotella intermedia]ATV32010.1 hypothetical protein CTM46_10915 [Prevotella intermedia]PJI21402.1 hypothetical protein CTM45_11345 [Prevotella intermedia]
MDNIDITEKLEEFYHHLSAADVDRTIFSAKFGDGKTEFLHQFKEKYSDEYTFYTLYPVNYQIAPNEQVMEYIKRDLLFQLIKNNTLTPIADIPKSVLFGWYLNENPLDIMKSITKCAFTILGKGKLFDDVVKRTMDFLKEIDTHCKKFKEFEEGIKNGEFEKAVNIIGNLSEGKGNIYELDSISYLIAKSIINQNKNSVLIIEDLDRIDPAHLFRILNIFSAHIDRHYLCSDKTINKDGKEKQFDELPNKFGFAKIIFVMDAESTEAVFKNFYGNSNYEGYINKFFSKRVFEYSITKYAHQLLYAHIDEKYIISQLLFEDILQSAGFKIEQKSVRDIAKVLDGFECAYRREEVRVTDDFCFLSDTLLVKLLAILVRLGAKKNHLSKCLEIIYSKLTNIGKKYIESSYENFFIYLLGCFVMNEDSFCNNGRICYNGAAYQISFYKDQDGYKDVKSVKSLGNMKYSERYEFSNINIDKIVEKALHYVN